MAESFELSLSTENMEALERVGERIGPEGMLRHLRGFLAKEAALAAAFIADFAFKEGRLRARSGAMRAGIEGRVTEVQGLPAIQIGVFRGKAADYARTANFGTTAFNPTSPVATIHPRRARALAFAPEGSPALSPSGVPKYASPRDFPDKLVFVPRKRGRLVGILYRAADLAFAKEFGISISQVQEIYKLFSSVDVRPSFVFQRGFEEFLPQLNKRLSENLAELLQGG